MVLLLMLCPAKALPELPWDLAGRCMQARPQPAAALGWLHGALMCSFNRAVALLHSVMNPSMSSNPGH